jgi:hypothetical protein
MVGQVSALGSFAQLETSAMPGVTAANDKTAAAMPMVVNFNIVVLL